MQERRCDPFKVVRIGEERKDLLGSAGQELLALKNLYVHVQGQYPIDARLTKFNFADSDNRGAHTRCAAEKRKTYE